MNEATYQAHIIKKLEREFLGCVVIKNDPNYIQGIPDLLILFGNRWAMLEVKASDSSPNQPNQEYHVEAFGRMSYCSFISPMIENNVFDDLKRALGRS